MLRTWGVSKATPLYCYWPFSLLKEEKKIPFIIVLLLACWRPTTTLSPSKLLVTLHRSLCLEMLWPSDVFTRTLHPTCQYKWQFIPIIYLVDWSSCWLCVHPINWLIYVLVTYFRSGHSVYQNLTWPRKKPQFGKVDVFVDLEGMIKTYSNQPMDNSNK